MIRVSFPEPVVPGWHEWIARCAQERHRVIQAARESRTMTFKPKIYSGTKEQVYLAADGPFRGKCAFCEETIRSNQHGDIEHFRPKAGVTDENDVTVSISGTNVPHPGYYWLAYDWQNLVPSCQLCNQPSMARTNGKRIGKWNRFPIKDENSRAVAPGQEAGEQPLLINPTQEDPAAHIGVDETGVMYARDDSPRGTMCIDIFGLNERSDLVNRRRQTYQDVRNLYLVYVIALLNGNSVGEASARTRLTRIEEGAEEFTAAAREALNRARQVLMPAVAALV